ncbi:aminotransferase, class III superfamily [marine gamma proteobacterium HTCC2148]|uniref:Aminotransferase class III-fold pyridoxal phosphate-dependent enzyme n=1 Tax=Candidatus Seongchinamella marina TaxID=2518990 RepID=A0ABT3SRY4_9GAMM|nr:aminotransferase [Candidatus Seongchinamella marina]EEB78673.1 aminotransferase, class III superfamily [marine gamma proteobacterium HTCC2148]MCX2972757.1 aminotransferase class III-fold pyridoxal phosphate-dependent enzyme [Candidatus Seongchinamella marina]
MSAVIYPTTNLAATEQLKFERADGVYVYDQDGKQYLEGMAGLWCTGLGYGNRELIDAISDQLGKLSFSHTFGGKTHQPVIDLGDKLADMVPVKDAMVFFGNSGSDANDSHIKMLRYYFNAIGKPEKRKIITRDRAYHGVTVAAGSLTSLPANLAHFDAPLEALGVLRTDHPHYYRGAQGDESEMQFVDRITNNLEQLILQEDPDTIAAFIAEPITGASGVLVPPPGYYEKVQAILEKYDILFWADEVITGFGRTGKVFGCETVNIQQPSMMTFAKQMSSAYYPISASVISGEMYEPMIAASEEVGVFGHGYTYSGHPVACASALKTLEIYERDGLYDNAATQGEHLQSRLAELMEYEQVGEVRGAGLIGAIELVEHRDSKAPDAALAKKVTLAAQENGLIVRNVAGNAIAVCPPLIINREQVDEMIDKLKLSLEQTI